MAILVLAAALTRPDALIYAAAFPLLLGLTQYANRSSEVRMRAAKSLAVYAVAFIAMYGLFLAFRWAYFGELLPNTYWVKTPADGASDLPSYSWGCFSRAVSLTGVLLAGPFFFIVPALALRRLLHRIQPEHLVLFVLLALSVLQYALLPQDWMGEYRFATPFVLFATVGAGLLVAGTLELIESILRVPVLQVGCLAVLVIGFSVFAFRSANFAADSTVPMSEVTEKFAQRFNQYEEQLGQTDASLLLPDMGGARCMTPICVSSILQASPTRPSPRVSAAMTSVSMTTSLKPRSPRSSSPTKSGRFVLVWMTTRASAATM